MAFWKEDWDIAREELVAWWKRKGLALHVTAAKDEPWENVAPPVVPPTLEEQWLNPEYRIAASVHSLSRTYFGGVAHPVADTMIGPGSLGTFLGSEPGFAP